MGLRGTYDSAYIDQQRSVGTGSMVKYADRLSLISELIYAAPSETEMSFNGLAMELIRSIYDDAYEYPNFYLPLGNVHKKIAIRCYVHDITTICSFFNHIVPVNRLNLAIECPACILECRGYYY